MSALCTKQLTFASKREAKRYLKANRRNRGMRAKHVYQCRVCPNSVWHLTSQTAGPRTDTGRPIAFQDAA